MNKGFHTRTPQLLTNFSDFNTHYAHIMQHYYLNVSRTPNSLLFEIVCKQLQYLALELAGPLWRLFAHFSSSSKNQKVSITQQLTEAIHWAAHCYHCGPMNKSQSLPLLFVPLSGLLTAQFFFFFFFYFLNGFERSAGKKHH